MSDHAAAGTGSSRAAGNETGFVHENCTSVRDFHLRAIGDCFEETQEGNFMRRQAGVRGRGRANLRDVHGAAGEGRKNQAVDQVMVRGEPQRRLRSCGHFWGM